MSSINSREPNGEFGGLLKFYRERTYDPKRGGHLTQVQLADLANCGISGTMIGHWETGQRVIKHQDRIILCALIKVLNQHEGISTVEEANQLLETGLYSQLSAEEIQEINPNWAKVKGASHPSFQSPVTIVLSLETIREGFDNFFHWSEADDHARSSWAGMFIWCLAAVTNRLSAHHLFNFLAFLIVWIMASWLVTPILQWPLDNPAVRLRASILLAFASVSIPVLIAFLSNSDAPLDQLENTASQKRTHFLLKLTGAAVGFNMVIALLLFLALWVFYLDISPLLWVWWLAMLAPLLMGYIGARRIPADRYKMYNGRLQQHPADPLFLTLFLLMGSGIGLFVYFGYEMLMTKGFAISFLLVIAAFALWYRQKQSPISDRLLIVIVGILIPFFILYLFLFIFPSENTLTIITNTSFSEQMLVIVYVISVTTVWVTVQLRNPPTITLVGAVGLLAILLILLATHRNNLFWGCLVTLLTVALWVVWGNKRFRSHFKIHASVGSIIMALGASLLLAIRGDIPIGMNVVGYGIVSTGLIIWAYYSNRSPLK